MDERSLEGGAENAGAVVRVGDTVRRPRRDGHRAVEALLIHLEGVGFAGAPRFLGIDEHGRQTLEYIEGTAHRTPPWQHDDVANAAALGRIAAWLRDLHDATAGFEPPDGVSPRRPLPTAGPVWTHGDVGYPNIVYRSDALVGLIDWEFAAPAHRCCDPAGLLAVSVRGPRPDADDHDRRADATKLAADSIASAYGMTDDERRMLPSMAAEVIDDLCVFQHTSMSEHDRRGWAWRALWFRERADWLAA